jgi:hypothetical protein
MAAWRGGKNALASRIYSIPALHQHLHTTAHGFSDAREMGMKREQLCVTNLSRIKKFSIRSSRNCGR